MILVTFLIRKIVTAEGAQKGYQDYEVAASRLTIGRGTDQDLLLPGDRVALRHAELSLLGGMVQISSDAALGVVVNGRTCHTANLKVGDQVLIGDYYIVLIDPPDNEVDCAITVQQLQPQEYDGLDVDDFAMDLKSVGWLRKRALTWLLFFAFLLICLGIPLWLIQNPEMKENAAVPLPTDKLWLSGPLHREHAFIGGDCKACHAAPFEPVQDNACGSCHEDVSHHVPESHPAKMLFSVQTCASCHHEHNEQQRMVMEDQRFCSSCHRVLATVMGKKAEVGNVSDFTSDHPDFRLSLLQPKLVDGDWSWMQTGRTPWTEELKEQNHLRFDHQQHLDDGGLKNESGEYETLQCASCHQVSADGFSMAPVTMENSCARCHSLAFDVARPDREVPHAPPEKVIANLREYFSTRFIEERMGGENDNSVRRPGVKAETPRLQKEGLEWVEARTQEVAQDMFERRACVTCHEVDVVETSSGKTWHVRPNRLNQDWFVAAPFPHYKHRNQECSDCHAARDSTESSDILMPHIEQCQDCHGGANTEDHVLSMCVTCHEYHQPETGLMTSKP